VSVPGTGNVEGGEECASGEELKEVQNMESSQGGDESFGGAGTGETTFTITDVSSLKEREENQMTDVTDFDEGGNVTDDFLTLGASDRADFSIQHPGHGGYNEDQLIYVPQPLFVLPVDSFQSIHLSEGPVDLKGVNDSQAEDMDTTDSDPVESNNANCLMSMSYSHSATYNDTCATTAAAGVFTSDDIPFPLNSSYFSAPLGDPFATPAEDPCVPIEDPCVPIEDPCAPLEDPHAPLEDPCVPLEDPCAPLEDPCEPLEDPFARPTDLFRDSFNYRRVYGNNVESYTPASEVNTPKLPQSFDSSLVHIDSSGNASSRQDNESMFAEDSFGAKVPASQTFTSVTDSVSGAVPDNSDYLLVPPATDYTPTQASVSDTDHAESVEFMDCTVTMM